MRQELLVQRKSVDIPRKCVPSLHKVQNKQCQNIYLLSAINTVLQTFYFFQLNYYVSFFNIGIMAVILPCFDEFWSFKSPWSNTKS